MKFNISHSVQINLRQNLFATQLLLCYLTLRKLETLFVGTLTIEIMVRFQLQLRDANTSFVGTVRYHISTRGYPEILGTMIAEEIRISKSYHPSITIG